MKAVLISIQPYWVFLIIARIMGWNVPHEKTVEVRKNFPHDSAWSRKTLIYCSKDMRSFKRIPEQYQPFMRRLMGKVIGEFMCDRFYDLKYVPLKYYGKPAGTYEEKICEMSCLSVDAIKAYLNGKHGFGWHISDLKIYDKPKELGEFRKKVKESDKRCLGDDVEGYWRAHGYDDREDTHCLIPLISPPQSWFYVEA